MAPRRSSATNAAPRFRGRARLAALRGSVAAMPRRAAVAEARERTGFAARTLGDADAGAEIHQGLREIARPRRGHQRLAERCELRFGLRQRVFDREQPRDDALGISVHRGDLFAEGDRGDRAGGVGADAGKRAQGGGVRREAPAMVAHDRLRRAMEIARPRRNSRARPRRRRRRRCRPRRDWRHRASA